MRSCISVAYEADKGVCALWFLQLRAISIVLDQAQSLKLG